MSTFLFHAASGSTSPLVDWFPTLLPQPKADLSTTYLIYGDQLIPVQFVITATPFTAASIETPQLFSHLPTPASLEAGLESGSWPQYPSPTMTETDPVSDNFADANRFVTRTAGIVGVSPNAVAEADGELLLPSEASADAEAAFTTPISTPDAEICRPSDSELLPPKPARKTRRTSAKPPNPTRSRNCSKRYSCTSCSAKFFTSGVSRLGRRAFEFVRLFDRLFLTLFFAGTGSIYPAINTFTQKRNRIRAPFRAAEERSRDRTT